jgi:N-acetylneuraminic acid mutarotase
VHRGRIYLAGGLTPDIPGAPLGLSDRLYVYDPATDRWTQGPSLPEPRHHPYLVSSGDRLFSIGGFVETQGGIWHGSTDILMLEEGQGRWVEVADLLHPQSETVAAYIEGKIYLASGRRPGGQGNAVWNDQVDIASVQVFDPVTYAVTAGPSAPSARNSAAGAVIDGRFYVVGGRTVTGGNQSATEVFDPATSSWRTLSPMPNAQGGTAAAAIGGRLYVFGGEFFGPGGSGVYEEVWVYDPERDSWAAGAPMPEPRHGLGAVTIDDVIYVVAGALQASGSGTSDLLSVFRP